MHLISCPELKHQLNQIQLGLESHCYTESSFGHQSYPFTCSPARARRAKTKTTSSRRPMRRERRGGAFDPRVKRQHRDLAFPCQYRTHALHRCMDYGVSLQLQHEPAEPPTRLPRDYTLQLQVRAHSLAHVHTVMRSRCNALRLYFILLLLAHALV